MTALPFYISRIGDLVLRPAAVAAKAGPDRPGDWATGEINRRVRVDPSSRRRQ